MTDDHEYIIKMPSGNSVPEYGLGYEIFNRMKFRLDDIAEFVAETDESVTFGELLDAYTRVAINLRKLNLANDDIIAICAQNHKQTSMPYIGGLLNGNIVTCVDPLLVPREKSMMLRKVTPKILFVDEDFLQNIEETLKILQLDIKIVVFGQNANGHISFEEFLRATQEEIKNFEPVKLNNNEVTALIVFSSGTTGPPKGICLSHLAILACTGMVEQPLDDNIDISSLKLLACSGANLPSALYSKLKKLIPNVYILSAYGLTEACGVTLVFDLGLAKHREFLQNKPDSCGAPVPGIFYKIVDPETEEILGPYKPGELRIKGTCLTLGYHNEDSSELFDSDGYLKTGDILQYDEDRCFYFMDRLKEVFKYRGYKWSPTTLENILNTHPLVDIAVVIGIPNAECGHLPMGVVKVRSNCNADPEELLKYVDKFVDANKRLRAGVKILDDLPITATGKINKRKLRDMILAGEK